MAISRTVDATCSDRSERSYLLKPNLAAHYPTVTRGEGPNLFDSLGTRYFDGPSGAMTANLRHGLPGIGLPRPWTCGSSPGIAPFNNAIIVAPPLNATADHMAELAGKLGDGREFESLAMK